MVAYGEEMCLVVAVAVAVGQSRSELVAAALDIYHTMDLVDTITKQENYMKNVDLILLTIPKTN